MDDLGSQVLYYYTDSRQYIYKNKLYGVQTMGYLRNITDDLIRARAWFLYRRIQ